MTKEEVIASIGKKVCVKTKNGIVCGILQFAGENVHFPSWEFQVTIDRLPVSNVNPADVSLAPEQWSITGKRKEVSDKDIKEIFDEAKEKYGTTLKKLAE